MNKDLGRGSLLPLLIKFSIPSTIAVLTNIIYNITDRYFIGHSVGRYGMSALSIIFPLILLVNGSAMMFSIGGSTLTGIRLGEKNINEAKKVIATTIFWTTILGGFYTFFILGFLDEILLFLGGTKNNIEHALKYSRFLFPVIIAQMLYIVLCSFLRVEGRPKFSMVSNLISAFLNMFLDYIFIVIFSMGMMGAALATSISTILSTVFLLIYFMRSKYLKFQFENIELKFKIIKKILSIGSSAFLNQILNGILVFIMNTQLLKFGGDIALAAIGVITTVRSFINTSFIGFNQGRQPIISYNYGAKNYKRVYKTFILSSKIIITISIAFVLLSVIFAKYIAIFFLKDDIKLIEFTTWALRRNLFLMVATALYLSCANYFQSVGKGYITTKLLTIRLLILNIPLLYILPKFLGILGVLIAFPISDGIASIVAATVAYKDFKQMLEHKTSEA